MITVNIAINGSVIYARTAVNTSEHTDDGKTIYALDDGSTLEYQAGNGSLNLVREMLNTIHEAKPADRRKAEMDYFYEKIFGDKPK